MKVFFKKHKIAVIIMAAVIVTTALVATLFTVLKKNAELDREQAEFIEKLELTAGSYDENNIVLSGTNKYEAEALAKKLGATHTISTLDEDYFEQAMDFSCGKGYDYVFDATGNVSCMKDEFRFAANKAKVCMVGTPKSDLNFSVQEWELMNRKEFILTGSWMSYSLPWPGDEWSMTNDFFKNGKLIFDEAIIDRIVPLSKIADAFELYKKPGNVKGKILIYSEI